MISVVVPIYNEQENVALLCERLVAAGGSWGETFELILVDDGSHDDSPKMMRAAAEADSRFKIVTLSRNYGHQAAISAGLEIAGGDAVAIMDGDMQDPPEVIGEFLGKWREGFDVVYAIRKERKEGLLMKIAYKSFYRLLAWISDIDIPLDAGDFCLMDRRVRDVLVREMPERNRFLRGLRAYAGFKQVGVEYERDRRFSGTPKYSLAALIGLAVDGVLDFSRFPLKIASYLGFAISIPSFLLGMFFILHRLVGFEILGHAPEETPGLATLAVAIFFLGGVTLIILGILGEYIGRVYDEVKRRPPYLIDTIYQKGSSRRATEGGTKVESNG